LQINALEAVCIAPEAAVFSIRSLESVPVQGLW
jgi:hypothetical protein